MATTGASLEQIYNRLNAIEPYHPLSADTFSDWSMEAGDIIRVTRDGKNYDSPVHSSALNWKGQPQISVSSGGNEKRENISRQTKRKYAKGGSGIRNDGFLHQELRDAYDNLCSYFEVTESRMYAEFRGAYDGLTGAFEVTRSRMAADFKGAYDGLSGYFEVTRSRMAADFKGAYDGLSGYFEVTRSRMAADFKGAYDGLTGAFEVTRSRMAADFKGAYDGLTGTFEVTRSRMTADFKGAYDGLTGAFEVTRSRMAADFKGAYDGLRGSFEVTRSRMAADFKGAYDGLTGAFEVTRSRMAADFKGAYDGLTGAFEVTRSSFTVQLADSYRNLASGIEQSAGNMKLYVNNKTTKAQLLLTINGSGRSEAYLEADMVKLGGSGSSIIKLGDKISIGSGGTMVIGGAVSVYDLSVYAGHGITFNGAAGGQYWELTAANLVGLIKNIKIEQSGNTYSLYKKSFAGSDDPDADWALVGTFSRATTLNGAWSSGTYSVSASPQGNRVSTTIQIMSPTPNSTISKSGKTVTRNFTLYHGTDETHTSSTGFTQTISLDATSVYNDGWRDSYDVIGLNYSSAQELNPGQSRTIYPTGKATPSASSASIISKGITISAKTDANLVAKNIKSGVTIFGITGSYAPTHSPVASEFVAQSSDPGDGYTSRSVTPDANTKWYKYTVTCGGTTSNYKLKVDSTNRYNAGYDANHNTLGIYDEQDNLLNANHYYKTLQYGEEFKCWAGFKKTNNEFSWNSHVVSITAPPNNYNTGYDDNHNLRIAVGSVDDAVSAINVNVGQTKNAYAGFKYKNHSGYQWSAAVPVKGTLDNSRLKIYGEDISSAGDNPLSGNYYMSSGELLKLWAGYQGADDVWHWGLYLGVRAPSVEDEIDNIVAFTANENIEVRNNHNNSDGYYINGSTVGIIVGAKIRDANNTDLTTKYDYLEEVPTRIYNAGKAAGGGTHSISIDSADGPYRNVNEMKEATGQGTLTQILTGKTISSGYYAFRTTCGTAKKWYYFHV